MNLTEILYQLTARVTPSKFDQGVPYKKLVNEMVNFDLKKLMND